MFLTVYLHTFYLAFSEGCQSFRRLIVDRTLTSKVNNTPVSSKFIKSLDACFLLMFAIYFGSITNAVAVPSCSTGRNIVANGLFDLPAPGGGLTSWTVTGTGTNWIAAGGGDVGVSNDTANGTISQTNLVGWAKGLSNSGAARIDINLKWNNGTPETSRQYNFTVEVNSVIYAQMTTSAGSGTLATITYSNGASGNLTTLTASTTMSNWQIQLPATIPNTASLVLRYAYVAATGSSTDDLYLADVTVLSCTDFGDAPDAATSTAVGNYQTTDSDGGPYHLITTGLSLGTAIDSDVGTLQNTTATADDTNGTPDDEEGVNTFPALTTVSGQTYTVSVNTTNTTGSNAYLVGYIDFNKDGDFLDTGEKSTTVTVTGTNSYNVNFTTPAGMAVGTTYARFRLSATQAQAESSVGAATSGEVEDYQLAIATAPAVVAGYKSVKLTTDADASGTLTAGDTLTYTLSYVNTGGTSVTNFQLNDVLPADVAITAAGAQTVTVTGTGTAASKSASYTGAAAGTISDLLAAGATLAPQSVITVAIPVTVNLGYFGTLSNRASASGTGLVSAVQSVNVGQTIELPAIVTTAPYSVTVPASSISQTSPGTGATLATVGVNLSGAAYSCDGYFYQIRRVSGAASRLFRIARMATPYTQTQLLDFKPYDMNALAFNKQDGYFYALTSPTSTSGALMRIGQSGAEALGPISGLPAANYFNGTFDSAGNYYVLNTTGAAASQLYRIDVTNRTATAITLPNTVNSGDIAINPMEPGVVIYGINVSSLFRMVVTGTTATRTTVTVSGISASVGTAFFDASGTLYAYSDDGNFYQVNLTTGAATLVTSATGAVSSDGASCAFTTPKIDLVKTVGLATNINATTFDVPYTIKLGNKDVYSAPYVQVVDNLAQTFVAGSPTVAIQAGPTVTAGGCTANNSGAGKFDGVSKLTLLTGADTLASGASCSITFTARVTYPNVGVIPTTAQDNYAYASTITSTGTPNPGHGFSGGVLIQPPNLLSVDTSTNGATLPATAGGDTTSPTPVIFSGTSIAGTVFEDVNYGGGAGRNLTASSGVGLSGVLVELYDSTGAYVKNTTTDTSGKYAFYGITSGSTYYVRVVNSTVPSSRTGYVAGLLPVQTYRTDASTGTVTPITDHVGGEDPTKVDAGNASAGDIIDTTSVALGKYNAGALANGQAQSIAAVKVGGSITGIDFGYNFDTVVNTLDGGQGSLRQFILNSNALSNTGLAQVGQTAGKEVSIFMVSDGAAHAGLRAGLSSQLTGGVVIISPTTDLPIITDTNTSIDGTTQTTLIGDSNAAVLGTGGSVGVDSSSLSTVNGPEVQLMPASSDTLIYGLDLQGSNSTVRGLAIYGFGKNLVTNPSIFSGNIHITGSNALIEQNVLGTNAKNFAPLASGYTLGSGIVVENTSVGTISNNLIGFHDGTGIVLRKSSSFTINNNEISGNDLHNYGTMDGISTITVGASHVITGNLVINNGACGIDNGRQDDLIIRNNTIKGNGVSSGAGQTSYSFVETPGIRLGGSRAKIEKNIIEANYGAGILVRTAAASNENVNPTQNTFSQNSIFQNGNISNRVGKAPSRQIGIDLEVAGQNTNQGTAPFITPNNGANVGTPNDGMDYPVITEANLKGQVLTVAGYIGNTGPVASFGGANIEFFIGDVSDYSQSYAQVVTSKADTGSHWEGQTYLGNCVAYNTGRFSCVINRPAISGVFDIANLSLTATSTNGSTSEFGDRLASIPQDSVSGAVFLDIGTGGITGVANNGILDGTEQGIADAKVTLYDCATDAILGQSVTDGGGMYTIAVPAATPDGTEFCLRERNANHPVTYISTGASQTTNHLSETPNATGVTYTRSTDTIKFTYSQGNNYSTLNFGDIPANEFITDGVKSGKPGNTLLYTHRFIAGTKGTVTFSLPGATTSPTVPAWNEVLYTDSNCNGTIDSGDNQTVDTAISIAQGSQICLIVKEYIPASAPEGAINLVPIKADFIYSNASPTLTTSYSRQDVTTVADSALELKKRVRNVTLDGAGTPNWQVSNTAKSGEILEYQITYTNQGETDIKTLAIKDATPAYTTFVSASAGTLPDSLTGCNKTTPQSASPIVCSASDNVGGTGRIEWTFTGVLASGASGAVTFRIKLD